MALDPHVPPGHPADQPLERSDLKSRLGHLQLLEKARSGRIDVYFIGDSLTRRWAGTDYPQLLEHWRQSFRGWHAANFGWSGDRTEHILWRLDQGELAGVSPKLFVVQAGTNNFDVSPVPDSKVEDIARGIVAIVEACKDKVPSAEVVLVGVFPRNDDLGLLPAIESINSRLEEYAEARGIRFLNLNRRLADERGRLHPGMVNPQDLLHLELEAYRIWADALKPLFHEILGPPDSVDLAPPVVEVPEPA